MKKTLYHIGMLAAVALAFVACSKEVETNQPNEEVTHVATISLGKADVSTKTEVIEGETSASYKWLDNDAQYLHVYENGTEGTITNFSLNADKTVATLTVSFTGNPTAPYTYTAKYAKTLSGSNNPLVPAEQSPKANNFDPAADVLVSKETSDVTDLDERAAEFTFTMGRIVTVNKMTLTGLEAGEIISSVEFTLDKTFTGYASVDTENGGYKYSNGSKKLTLTYEGSTGTVPSNGQFPVYFTCAPVEAAGIVSVVVTTNKNVYTKANTLDPNPFDGRTITFAIGTMKRFTMAMAGYGEEISAGTVYTLVTNDAGIYDGATYIIATSSKKADGTASNASFALGLYTGGNNHAAAEVTKSSNTITINNTIAVEPVIVNSVNGGYSIVNAATGNPYNGYFFQSAPGESNYLKEAEGVGDVWSISIDDGVASIVAKNKARGYMYFNSNNGWFACYADKSLATDKANYTVPALYVDLTTCVEREESGLAYSVTSPIEVVWDNKESFVKPTLANPNNLTVTYSSSDETVATVDASTGNVTFVGNGTTTITASSAKTSTYKAGVATYQITVTGAPAEKGSKDNPYTVSEARAAAIALDGEASSNEVYVKGIVSEITTEYSTKYNNVTFNISDDGLTTSDQFEAFREKSSYSSSVAAGDAVVIKGTIIYYNSTKPGFQADNAIQSLLAKPIISGTESFTASASVTLSAADGATIYYTTDGTDPNTNSSVYSTPLSISETTTVKAVASKGVLTTGVATATFTKSSGDNFISVPEQTFTFSSLYSANTVLDGVSIDGTNCSMVFNKRDGGTATQYYTNGKAVRWYGGGTLAITAPTGYKITSIKITYSQTANSVSANGGSYDLSNSVGTWTGEVSNGSSVIFTQSGTSGHCRITSIVIN